MTVTEDEQNKKEMQAQVMSLPVCKPQHRWLGLPTVFTEAA